MTGGLFDVIPGYKEAVEKEQSSRIISYLPIPELVCGVEVKPLTPYHFLILEAVDNPFVVGGVPDPADIGIFLWVASTKFQVGNGWRLNRTKKRLLKQIGKLDYLETLNGIKTYMKDTFQDSPGVKMNGSLPFSSWFSFIWDTLAMEYGSSLDEVLHLPFKAIFQQIKVINKRYNPKAMIFNASDAVRTQYLKEINSIKD